MKGGAIGVTGSPNDPEAGEFGIKVLDRFLGPDENDSHWLTAVKLANEIGYPVLNVAAVSKYNGAPLWVRTTMSEKWVQLYLTKNYFHKDPLIAHMQKSNEQLILDCDDPKPDRDDPFLEEFKTDARELGYGRFRGIPFNWPTQSVYRIVTFGLLAGQSDTETKSMVNQARLLANVIATRVGAPTSEMSFGTMWPPKAVLTSRERELLYYLAIGLKNDRIAERCGLAEVTVRKHLLNARRKLGASTREHALAIALQNGLINL